MRNEGVGRAASGAYAAVSGAGGAAVLVALLAIPIWCFDSLIGACRAPEIGCAGECYNMLGTPVLPVGTAMDAAIGVGILVAGVVYAVGRRRPDR